MDFVKIKLQISPQILSPIQFFYYHINTYTLIIAIIYLRVENDLHLLFRKQEQLYMYMANIF